MLITILLVLLVLALLGGGVMHAFVGLVGWSPLGLILLVLLILWLTGNLRR
jgi:hypothetical protein